LNADDTEIELPYIVEGENAVFTLDFTDAEISVRVASSCLNSTMAHSVLPTCLQSLRLQVALCVPSPLLVHSPYQCSSVFVW